MEDNDDAEDPHDLSFSRNHILRASMVDNLVLSLDQFSGNPFDEPPYTPRSNSYDTNTTRIRKRGHTFSSSTSSENDIQHLRHAPQPPQSVPRVLPRNSVRYQKDLQRLPSIFGEDEDTARSKVYDAQRATQPRHPRRKKNTSTSGKSHNSSASSSIDLGHLGSLAGRLGGAGNRRSRSFDFGSRPRDLRPSKPLVPEGTPTSATFANSDTQNGMSANPLMRKNSTKSSKSAYIKKGRQGAPTNTSRNDSIPQLPSMKSGPSLSATDQKTIPGVLHEPATAPRPGFFRRVFGSSKTATVESHTAPNVLTKSHHGRATPVQDENSHSPATPPNKTQKPVRRTSTDASANKENQPVITKKSSAFFRRRKKSISNSVPPPLPLTLNSEMQVEAEPVVGTSPVSSLRAFMGPYLADPSPSATTHAHPQGHSRTNSMQGFYTPNLAPPTYGISNQQGNPRPKPGGHNRAESYGSGKTLKSGAKQPATLRIPHQDSFLADSSSVEEPVKRSPFDTPSEHERPPVRYRSSVNDLKLEHTTSASSLPSPVSNPRSATTRQGSWMSDKVSPSSSAVASHAGTVEAEHVPKPGSAKRQQSLGIPPKPSKGSPFASTSDVSDEYRSAPSTPLIIETPDGEVAGSIPSFKSLGRDESESDGEEYKRKAQLIYDHADEETDVSTAAAWLGDAALARNRVLKSYMELFDWRNQEILDSLRGLCDRIVLKGESQVIDRIMVAFAQRWCECNATHNFKSSGMLSP